VSVGAFSNLHFILVALRRPLHSRGWEPRCPLCRKSGDARVVANWGRLREALSLSAQRPLPVPCDEDPGLAQDRGMGGGEVHLAAGT